MAIGSGLGGFFGAAEETTWGTYTAADHFYKATKADLNLVNNFIQGGGIANGQFIADSARHILTTQAGTGDIELQFGTKGGHGLLLAHIFGDNPTPTVQGATTAYLQTHTLGNNTGKGLSLQAGVPQTDGTVVPYSLSGGKVTSATFACQTSDFLTLAMSVDGKTVVDTESAATPSYVTGIAPFHFGNLSVKLGAVGSEALVDGVRGISLTFERPQKTDSYYANGTPTAKAEPIMNDWGKISGSIDIDFANKADFIDRFQNGTSTSLVIDFKGSLIASTYYNQLTFSLPATFFEGATPTLDSNDVVQLSVPFVSQDDGTNEPITCAYTSTDTAL